MLFVKSYSAEWLTVEVRVVASHAELLAAFKASGGVRSCRTPIWAFCLTDSTPPRIWFRLGFITPETISHEVMHAVITAYGLKYRCKRYPGLATRAQFATQERLCTIAGLLVGAITEDLKTL